MIIKLPKSFYYEANNSKSFAYVSNGILYIQGYINYEDIMYSLAYAYHGYERCKYCGQALTPNKRTLDHIYPRALGGVSIPDNLLPCCEDCNQQKADLTPRQFNRIRRIANEQDRKQYFKRCHKDNSKFLRKGHLILPGKWLTNYDITQLVDDMNFDCLEEFKVQKVREFYELNHAYNHPIVVSSDDWLMKGKHIVYVAKENNDLVIPAIVLENVVVIRDAK